MASKKIGVDTVFVSLNMLDGDPNNPRRTEPHAAVEALAASIAAHGLLQPLGVVPSGEDGRHVVRFGGRRLAALRLLVERKKLGRTAAIACRLLTEDGAAEAALAENVSREAMHPADEFEAFAALHQGGRGLKVEQIAARFGVPVRLVRQRLRLASVAPALLDHYRAGTLTLDVVMAFAITEDQEAQQAAFASLPSYLRTPANIRDRLTSVHVRANDRRAALVGLAAYEAAGGQIIRDLFSDDDDAWLADSVLLDRLVTEKLTEAAAPVRGEGWAWVEVLPGLPPEFHRLGRVWPEQIAASAEDEARMTAIHARLEDLDNQNEDLTPEETAEVLALGRELETLENAQSRFLPEDVARAGAVVTLDWNGVRIVRGLLREEPEGGDDAGACRRPDAEGAEDLVPPRAPAAPVEPKEPVLSAQLAGELAAHRTAGLQAEVAARPHLALCVLVQALVETYRAPCNIRVAESALAMACPGIDDSEARQRLDALHVRPLPEGAALLPWLVEQDTDALLAILSPLVARGVDAGAADWTTAAGAASPAAQVAGIALLDMRLWWKPTPAAYLGRVSKGLILDAVREGAGSAAAKRIEGMKKAPMAEAAASLLDGTGWLPALLRVPAAPAVEDEVEMAEAAD